MQNNKLSIIISTYDDIKNPHYGGGGAIAVHQVAKRLAVNYKVTVLSWNHNGKITETIDGVVYERFGSKSLSPKVAMFVYQLLLPFQVLFRKYDVWLESFCPPFTTAFLPLFTKRPIVGIVHMLAAEDMERKYKLPFHLIENAGIKTYRRIIVTSPMVKEKVLKVHPSGLVTVISNGIDKVEERNYPKENYILFLGRIEVDQKGLDLLVTSFKQVTQRSKKSLKLIIAGDGDALEMAKLKRLIANQELNASVVFAGRVSGKKKAKLLRHASCIVVSSRFETYSLVALEALAAGVPLVCFAIKGLSWLPEKIAKKVPTYDTTTFAKAIMGVVTNPKLAATLREAGKKYASTFTWDEIAKQYNDYIGQITKGKTVKIN